VDAAGRGNRPLVGSACCLRIGGVAVRHVDGARRDVDVIGEVLSNERSVRLAVVGGKADVLVEQERVAMSERQTLFAVPADQLGVDREWRVAGRQAEYGIGGGSHQTSNAVGHQLGDGNDALENDYLHG